MFRNFDPLSAVLLAIWLLSTALITFVSPIWIAPLMGLAFVAGCSYFHNEGLSK